MHKCFTGFPRQHTADPADVSKLSKGSSAGGLDMCFHVQMTIKDYAKIPGHVCDPDGFATNHDVSPVGFHGVTWGEYLEDDGPLIIHFQFVTSKPGPHFSNTALNA